MSGVEQAESVASNSVVLEMTIPRSSKVVFQVSAVARLATKRGLMLISTPSAQPRPTTINAVRVMHSVTEGTRVILAAGRSIGHGHRPSRCI